MQLPIHLLTRFYASECHPAPGRTYLLRNRILLPLLTGIHHGDFDIGWGSLERCYSYLRLDHNISTGLFVPSQAASPTDISDPFSVPYWIAIYLCDHSQHSTLSSKSVPQRFHRLFSATSPALRIPNVSAPFSHPRPGWSETLQIFNLCSFNVRSAVLHIFQAWDSYAHASKPRQHALDTPRRHLFLLDPCYISSNPLLESP